MGVLEGDPFPAATLVPPLLSISQSVPSPPAFPLGGFLPSPLPPTTLSHLCAPLPHSQFHFSAPTSGEAPACHNASVPPSCCPGAGGRGGGCADVTGRSSAPPCLTQISSSVLSPNQFTFIASAAQKQFFKNKKVSTSKTNQFSESSCRHRRGSWGRAAPSLPAGPLPPAPSLLLLHDVCH